MTRVLVRDVMRAAAEQAGLTVKDLEGERRTRAVAHPRMRAMYVARQVTEASWAMIAYQFGGRDHSTAINAHRQVSKWLQDDPRQMELVHDLLCRFGPTLDKTIAAVRAETEGLAA